MLHRRGDNNKRPRIVESLLDMKAQVTLFLCFLTTFCLRAPVHLAYSPGIPTLGTVISLQPIHTHKAPNEDLRFFEVWLNVAYRSGCYRHSRPQTESPLSRQELLSRPTRYLDVDLSLQRLKRKQLITNRSGGCCAISKPTWYCLVQIAVVTLVLSYEQVCNSCQVIQF